MTGPPSMGAAQWLRSSLAPKLPAAIRDSIMPSYAEYLRINELLRRIPDHRWVVYDGQPHNITNAVPERCAQDLRRFLVG